MHTYKIDKISVSDTTETDATWTELATNNDIKH